jgi:WD40 repeat protein
MPPLDRPRFIGWDFCTTGNGILTCDSNGQISQWTGGQWETSQVVLNVGTNATLAAFLPDRQQAVIGYGHGEVNIWDWADAKTPRTILSIAPGTWSWVFRRHGERMAIGRFDQRILVDFNVRSWEEVDRWEAPGTLVSIAFTPDDRFCIMGGYRGQISVYDRTLRKTFSPLPNVPNSTSVSASPDGRAVAVANEQGYAELWQLPAWSPRARFGGFLHSVGDLAFSPDGARLAAGSSGVEALRLFELRQLQPLITLEAPGSLFAPKFSPSGDFITALNVAGDLWIWPAPSWGQIHSREDRPQAER